MNERFRDILIMIVAVPVLGFFMGGVYSVPAMRVTNCREPWYTLVLGVGLTATVFAIGFARDLPLFLLVGAWIFACAALLARRAFGKLDHNLERFGIIHMLTLFVKFWIAIFAA